VEATLFTFNEIDRINGVEIVLAPVHAANIPFAPDDDGRSRHERLLVSSDNTTGAVYGIRGRHSDILLQCLSVFQRREFAKRLLLPPLRHAIDNLDVLVAGKAEVE